MKARCDYWCVVAEFLVGDVQAVLILCHVGVVSVPNVLMQSWLGVSVDGTLSMQMGCVWV